MANRLRVLFAVLAGMLTLVPLPASGATCARLAPCNLRSTATTATTVDVAWAVPRDILRFGGYAVMRMDSGASSWRHVVTVSPWSTTSYRDVGLGAGKTYTYEVRQLDLVNLILGVSNRISVTTPSSPVVSTTTTVPATTTTVPATTTTTAPPITTTTLVPSTTTTSVPPSTNSVPTRTFSGNVSLAGFVVPAGERWSFDPNVSTTVEITANVVVRGVLEMRPSSAAVIHTLRFVGINEANFVGGGMDVVASDVGLWVTGAGRLDVAGAPKTAWARSSGGIGAGASTVTLASQPSGWAPGDELVITPTLPPTVQYHYLMDDLATVASVGGSTVGLTKGVQFAHPVAPVPGKPMTAEVGNLSRNARIEGTASGRSHIWIRSTQPQSISNAAIRHMGPRNGSDDTGATVPVKGRYALHLHESGDGSGGSVVSGVVLRNTGNNGFAPHNSSGVTFRNNVVYDIIGEAFWWDEPTSTAPSASNDIVIENNLVDRVRSLPDYRGFTLTAFVAAEGSRNVMRGNVASGVAGNTSSAGFKWREAGGDSVWVFEDNVSHNNAVNGIWIWQNNPTVHVIDRLTAYHNGNAGILTGAYANNYVFRDSDIYANGGRNGDGQGAQVVAWAASAGGPDGSRVTYDRLRIDAAGLTDHAMTVAGRAVDRDRREAPGMVTGNTFRGYTVSAIAVEGLTGGEFPTAWQMVGNDYGSGVPFQLSTDIHELTALSVLDLGVPFTLRRADQSGTYVAAWNARRS